MLIPRGVLKMEKIASTEKTRYAMNGVAFDRDPVTHEAIACATDGKRLLECRWDDSSQRNEFTAPIDLSERAKFFTVVPREALRAEEKNISKKEKPCFRFLALEETTANGTVKLATMSQAGARTSEVKSIEGHFPPYLDVMPPAKGYGTVRVALNARFLLELAEALAAARESEGEDCADSVILEIKDAQSAIVVRSMAPNLSGVTTRAVLMPINAGEGDERDKPVAKCQGKGCREIVSQGVEKCNACKRKRAKRRYHDKPSIPTAALVVVEKASPACPSELAPSSPVLPSAVLGAADLEW